MNKPIPVACSIHCPNCKENVSSNEIFLLYFGEGTDAGVYLGPLADDITGLSFSCRGCGEEFSIAGVNVLLHDGRALKY